ncbi:Glutathione import ATP-binding protein GsiA [Thalassocella blandensis]|nr:Glutathione import ATP-binding protein GsiA [Thalassocella blandensis]
MAILEVKNLSVSFYTRDGETQAVQDVSFSLEAGEILGIVGESGSGKSVTCYSMLGLVPMPPGKIVNGQALYHGQDLLTMDEKSLRDIRGKKISMIFQDPMTSLNPYMRIGKQIMEAVQIHEKVSKKEARERAISALREVGIVDAEKRVDAYPHEFSGGMRQRVMIAMALATEPEILIADEPTTALDVTIQKQILDLLKSIQAKRDLTIIFITHDLAVIKSLANHVVVMQKGKIMEEGEAQQVFNQPQHDYTKKLLAAIPTTAKSFPSKVTESTPVLLDVHNLHTTFTKYSGIFFKKIEQEVKAVNDISLSIKQGEILGLVGESGSGKSTFGRSIIRLIESQSGDVLLNGVDLTKLNAVELKTARRDFQMIFQDPYASLNPRMTVFDTLAEPLLTHKLATRQDVGHQVNQLMDDVGLERKHLRKYPHEFSGGQRQRIAIARALALKPKLIIADEPVSALDVTIQAQVLKLLLELTDKHNLTMLFISHDLSVVRFLCDRVAVMQHGVLVELDETETLFNNPQHSYTQKLLSAIPALN